ncbi:MAG: Crp/Fnr family transcriptional regulator [Rhodospirillaceae bacterium]|nr:Crp/Fnr family transcriptional regulator [Rhodospirillaceae bacterium]MBT4489978.1 Crp/Fnr family transcriptional regulator [Rhodospirillaceae bacterium]MBT5193522.1 Crp/Fnr family transcriptional regulator [Rhodospirillaceae bacterium]MBT5897117.1 Crp/Fnr family transcriptional regulator [Rhodospirillaceae bacterium]MBT6428264.1 Crp/Fnr family transcriptional regulator [Rhodospirillaceae bacterium]
MSGIGLLDGLSEQSKADLEARCRWQRYVAGDKIMDKNSGDRDVYFVAEGAVQVVNYSFAGQEISLAHLQAGSYFGELAAIDSMLRSASVVALEDCLLGALPPRLFINQLADHPDMAVQVLCCLAGIVRGCDERIMDLSTLTAMKRVYLELLRLAEESPVNPGNWLIKAMPTHKVIAGLAATTRETVTRAIAQLTVGDIIESKNRMLFIRDRERLENLVRALGDDMAR